MPLVVPVMMTTLFVSDVIMFLYCSGERLRTAASRRPYCRDAFKFILF